MVLALAMLASAAMPAALADEAAPNAAEKVRFDRKSLTLYVGERYDMPAFLTSDGAGGITWKTSNKAVVSITGKGGLAIGKKPGAVTITAIDSKKQKATIKLVVKKNKLDKIYGEKPGLSAAKSNDYELVLKSMEIANPTTVVCEYYLVFNYPASYRTTRFTRFYAKISAHDAYYGETRTIVEGSPKLPISINCRGQRVKAFKVTFTGSSVKHTDIALIKSGKSTVKDRWQVYLEWK